MCAAVSCAALIVTSPIAAEPIFRARPHAHAGPCRARDVVGVVRLVRSARGLRRSAAFDSPVLSDDQHIAVGASADP
eukprot:SAG25_NODE_12044_length_289_cov_0.810526_1_plen_76_part_10